MPTDNHEFDPDHLEWLVKSRYKNQQSALQLYALIKRNKKIFDDNIVFQATAQDLAAIAFSLWRAVFLSRLSDDKDQMIDLNAFLEQLVAHNTISYQVDYRSREWTFRFYLKDAQYRLVDLSHNPAPRLLAKNFAIKGARTEKEQWSAAQAALTGAIREFRKEIDGRRGSGG